MHNNYSTIFSDMELSFLREQADEYGWYLWTNETKTIIEGMCARRLMAANGDFKVVLKNSDRLVNLKGYSVRSVDTVLRYYELVGVGRIAFRVMAGERVQVHDALEQRPVRITAHRTRPISIHQ